jgi:hypothetical protein
VWGATLSALSGKNNLHSNVSRAWRPSSVGEAQIQAGGKDAAEVAVNDLVVADGSQRLF